VLLQRLGAIKENLRRVVQRKPALDKRYG
jgi:hypothetical protein